MSKIVLYTANFGEKDRFNDEATNSRFVKLPNIEYVYFSDKQYSSKTWNVITEAPKFTNPNQSAKWYKLHSHVLFPNDTSIWTDAHYSPYRDLEDLLVPNTPLILFNHYRDCVYKEAEKLTKIQFQPQSMLDTQINFYKKRGMPKNTGFYQGRFLIRTPECGPFNMRWWNQILEYTRRDQLSLAYLLWRKAVPFKAYSYSRGFQYFNQHKRHLHHH